LRHMGRNQGHTLMTSPDRSDPKFYSQVQPTNSKFVFSHSPSPSIQTLGGKLLQQNDSNVGLKEFINKKQKIDPNYGFEMVNLDKNIITRATKML